MPPCPIWYDWYTPSKRSTLWICSANQTWHVLCLPWFSEMPQLNTKLRSVFGQSARIKPQLHVRALIETDSSPENHQSCLIMIDFRESPTANSEQQTTKVMKFHNYLLRFDSQPIKTVTSKASSKHLRIYVFQHSAKISAFVTSLTLGHVLIFVAVISKTFIDCFKRGQGKLTNHLQMNYARREMIKLSTHI